MSRLRKILLLLIIFFVGLTAGGYLLKNVQPRSFLTVNDCKMTCFKPNELLGLIGSVGIKMLPGAIPFVVKETDKTIVIDSPIRQAPIHYVIVPKKDIRDIADISEKDKEYLIDAYAVIGELIRERHLTEYKIYTNGPDYQAVNYLHFHLLSKIPKQ